MNRLEKYDKKFQNHRPPMPLEKRLFDIFFSLTLIVMLSPLFLVVALAIYFSDRSSPLFIQGRVGRNLKPFRIFKFRSMAVNTADVPSSKAHLVKITPIGRIIRCTNLDELPQLFNILHGSMSFVGPRPALSSQNNLLKLRVANGSINANPGLTGLAQINAFDGMCDDVKADFDGAYAHNITLLGDIKIILQTAIYLFRKQPVY